MIKTELIKKINETYYKEYQDFNLTKSNFPMKNLDNINLIYLEVINLVKDGTLYKKNEFFLMISDIFIFDKEKFYSVEANILARKQLVAENRVNRKVETLSEETLQLIGLLNSEFKEDTFIVGGFVRDAIAGRESNDVDFCTSIPYDKLQNIFRKNGWDTKDTGKQFLVLNITHPFTKENFEIAALRKDKDNSGAQVGTIDEDAQRRDFVNSCIYYNVRTKELIDPSGRGIKHCQNNILGFMGSAKDRIIEDPARVFRGYKMIGRGWEPESKTLRAIRENFEYAINNTNAARVMKEIEKMVGM